MGRENDWIAAAAFFGSGMIYVYTIEPRLENKKRMVLGTIVWILFMAFVNYASLREYLLGELSVRLIGYLFLVWLLHMCRVLSWFAAAYYAIWAFFSWQLLYELYLICARYAELVMDIGRNFDRLLEITLFACGHVIVAVTIGRWIADGGQKKIGPRQILLAALTFLAFQAMVVTPEEVRDAFQERRWMNQYLSQLLLAVTLYLQNELFKKSEIRQELDLMNLLWKKEQEHYRLSKETIALINQKCHDLKHQIYALRGTDVQEREAYLEEIAASVRIYEAIVKTGNEALDTILTEKSLYCKEKGITLSCVADGEGLSFIHTVDLFAILGNAIDNAIEAVSCICQEEMRCIDVLIYRRKGLLVINVVNPLQEQLVYEDDLPVTTKADKGFHGFGLRSIKYMAKKYDGVLRIQEEAGCFSLMVLLPIPPEMQCGQLDGGSDTKA